MSKIAVIGAGIAGLTAAYELNKKGHQTKTYEKADYPGGRTYTCRKDNVSLNTGAVFFTNFYSPFFEYLQEFGLEGSYFEMNHDVNFMDGFDHHLYKFESPMALFGLPKVSLRSKLKFAWYGLKTQLSKRQFSLIDIDKLAARDTQSITSFIDKHGGRDLLDHFIKATTEPYFYWSTDEVSSSLFESMAANTVGAKFYTFKDGMDTLAKAIAARAGNIEYGTEITQLDVAESGKIIVSSQNTTEEFDGLVVATTANLAHLLTKNLSLVDDTQKEFLGSQRYSSNVNVGFWVDRSLTHSMPTHNQPNGEYLKELGAIVVQGDRSEETITRNGNAEKMVVYFLDTASKKLLGRSDSDIAEVAFEAIQQFFPHVTTFKEVIRITRHLHAIPIPEPGRFKQASEFVGKQKAPIVFAGDYLATSNIDGAIQTGRQAAQHF